MEGRRQNIATSSPANPADQAVVFVSYAREDQEFVFHLSEALQLKGIRVCGDWQLVRGEDYQQQLGDLQLGSDVAIFVISPDSVRSAPCRSELDRATLQGQRVLPVVFRDPGNLESDLPPALTSPQWTFLRPADDFVTGIQTIVEAVNTDIDFMPVHRRLLQSADTWQRNGYGTSYLLRKDFLKQAEEFLLKSESRQNRFPQPTALQLKYIHASQQARAKGSRVALATVALVAVSMFVLAVIAFLQRNQAQRQTRIADAKTQEANFQKRIAEDQTKEANRQQAIAKKQKEIGEQQTQVANQRRDEAEREAKISTSERLATAAFLMKDRFFDLGALLALEAERTYDTFEARNSLFTFYESTTGLLGYLRQPAAAFRSAFSPNGRLLAVACDDGTIQVWDVASHLLAGRPIAAHNSRVYAVAFSPDGKLLASAGLDSLVRLWDVASHNPKGTLTGHKLGVRDVAFSPNGDLLASAGANGEIRLWNVARLDSAGRPLEGHAGPLNSVAFAPKGELLVSAAGPGDRTIRLWDVAQRRQFGKPMDVRLPADGVRSVALSPDGKLLASAGGDGTIQFWDVASQQKHGDAFSALEGVVVTAVSFSPDGRLLAAAGLDGSVQVWDVESRRSIGEPLQSHKVQITGVAFSPTGQVLALSGSDGTVQLREVLRFDTLKRENKLGYVFSISFPRDQHFLAFASERGIGRWDLKDHGPLVEPHYPKGTANGVAASPDGRLLASWGTDKVVRLWSTVHDGQLGEPVDLGSEVSTLAFSPDSRRLAAGLPDGTIRLWDAARDGTHLEALRGHDEGIQGIFGIAFNPDGSQLASAGEDGTVRVWDLARLREVKKLLPVPGIEEAKKLLPDSQSAFETLGRAVALAKLSPKAVAFSPDGSMLASVGGDGLIHLWATVNYEPIGEPLKGYLGPLERIAFSPDSKMMAVLGKTTVQVQLWDLARRERIGEAMIDQRNDIVGSVVFSPDGRFLVTASRLGIGAIDLAPDAWATRLCGIISRNLSGLEWEQYFGAKVPYHRTCANLPDGAAEKLASATKP